MADLIRGEEFTVLTCCQLHRMCISEVLPVQLLMEEMQTCPFQRVSLRFRVLIHNGPTSVIKSASKIDHLRTGGTLLNQKFSPSFFEDEDSYGNLTALIRSYFSLDGHHIQFNVVNAETLKDAQKHPENIQGSYCSGCRLQRLF